MRVLMLGWEYPPHISGGLGTACAGLTRGLAARGVDVVFVLPRVVGDEDAAHMTLVAAHDGSRRRPSRVVPNAYETPETFERRVVERTARYGGRMSDEVRRYADAVERIAERERFDVVHGHDWMTYPAAVGAARASRVPLVLHVHSLESDRAGPRANPDIVAVERRGFAAADVVVCVSRYTADEVARLHGVPRSKLRVVHNAVEGRSEASSRRGVAEPPSTRAESNWVAGEGHAVEERRRAPLLHGEPAAEERRLAPNLRRIAEPVVLFLGRVTYQKGPEVFLEAAKRVVGAEPNVKFVVAGGGDLWPRLVERAAALGLARHVHFTGFLAAEDVERAYAAADVFVMPSVSEPFGIAPLEAAARGVPVVVSRRAGVAEVMKGALRVDAWNVEDLADKILAVLRRPALRRELVRRGRRDVRRLTWERQAALLREIYERIIP